MQDAKISGYFFGECARIGKLPFRPWRSAKLESRSPAKRLAFLAGYWQGYRKALA